MATTGEYSSCEDAKPKNSSFRFRSFQRTSEKSIQKLGFVVVRVVGALAIGLCVGVWPCTKGFSGYGVGNCQDIDECKVRILINSQIVFCDRGYPSVRNKFITVTKTLSA